MCGWGVGRQAPRRAVLGGIDAMRRRRAPSWLAGLTAERRQLRGASAGQPTSGSERRPVMKSFWSRDQDEGSRVFDVFVC